MTRSKTGPKVRPANSYPPEYLIAFQRVIMTGKEFVVDSLGSDKGPYVNMRHQMNTWRQQLQRENSPLAPSLFAVVACVEERNGQYVLVLKNRDDAYARALKWAAEKEGEVLDTAIAPMDGDIAPTPPPSPNIAGTKAISDIFGQEPE